MSVRRLSLIVEVLMGVLVLQVAPVNAAVVYKPLDVTFGAFEKPTGVSVDQSNGNVYVADSNANVVDVFGSEGGSPFGSVVSPVTGAPKDFEFGGSSAQTAFDGAGDLYVSDPRHNVVDKLKLNGSGEYEYVCQFTGYGRGCEKEPVGAPTWEEPHGVAVDSHGNVYIAAFFPGVGAVYEFNAAGENVREFSGGHIEFPAGVAVAPDGTVYINSFLRNVVKITPENTETVLYQNTEEQSTAVTVDTEENVFVDTSATIIEYNKTGEQTGRFGKGLIGARGGCFEVACSEGVAVYDLNQNVYVTNRETGKVVVFTPKNLPVPNTGTSENISKTATTVTGTVDPDGEEAHYFFEYATSEEYELNKTYNSTTAKQNAGSGSTSVNVEADLSELSPGTVYHYKLVAENTNGTNPGEDETFTTLPAVTFKPCPPVDLHGTSGTLCEMINPEGSETHYGFAYGLEIKTPEEVFEYGHFTGFESAGAGSTEEQFTASITELEPATTYHYRVIAFNEINGFSKTVSDDETFTTPPAEPTVNDQAPFATGIAPHEATLNGTINPGKGVTSYHFVYGTTSAYGLSTTEAYTPLNYEDDSVEQLVTGLQPDTVYHYALIATNTSGAITGPDEQFRTPPASTPTVVEPGPNGPSLQITGDLGIVQPTTPQLIAFAPVAFPTQTGTGGGTPKALTNAQKLSRALKACKKKPRAKRVKCGRQARKKYAKKAPGVAG